MCDAYLAGLHKNILSPLDIIINSSNFASNWRIHIIDCKDCNYHYTVKNKSDVKSQETRRLALKMYLEGLGFRAIGRILKISHVTVYNWVKEWGKKYR